MHGRAEKGNYAKEFYNKDGVERFRHVSTKGSGLTTTLFSILYLYVCKAGDTGLIPGSGRFPQENDMAIPSSTLAWEIPWTQEPGGLQPLRSQELYMAW